MLIGSDGQRYESNRVLMIAPFVRSAEEWGREWCVGKNVEFVSAHFEGTNLVIDIIVDPGGERQEKTVTVVVVGK